MLRIGDFSRLCLVPVSALRYYDEVGLLKPVRVDGANGYRYYSASQLPRLNRLLVLKDMGLSLEQIARLLDDNLTPEQILGMLKIKRAELQQQLSEGQIRLHRVENWLNQFEQEQNMPDYDVIIKKVAPSRVYQVRDTTPNIEQLGPTMDRLFNEVATFLGKQGARPTGPAVTVNYAMELNDSDIEIGACMPCDTRGLVEDERVKLIELPEVEQMATVVHRGSFDTINQAYEAILKWSEANGYQPDGYSREVYLEYERGGDPAKYVTEVGFPVSKAGH